MSPCTRFALVAERRERADRSWSRPIAVVASIALLLAAGACGGGEEDAEPAPAPETVDPLPDLPPRWSPHANRAGGLALGVPPGWRARDRGIVTQIDSFDRLVVVTVIPDRTRQGMDVPLEDFARRAFEALGGYEEELAAEAPPQPFEHRYEGAVLETMATAAATGVRQRVRLIVLRRGPHVTFTVQIAASAGAGEASGRLAERMISTLRSQPLGGAPPG